MKKISFSDVAPHLLAVLIFLVVTIMFFSPVFFEKKALGQHDIQQFIGSSKAIQDYRKTTGEEPLWADAMFSGMPAYLINMEWSNGAVSWVKRIGGLFLPHPVINFFWAFLCYYILLLTFRVRPYLAIAGALAFGLSSFIILGLAAGHNGRIGAIAFMPLVMAGIHLAFSGNRKLGFALTAIGLSLQLRENHLQMTYYLFFIVLVYGLVQLVVSFQEKKLKDFGIALGLLVPAALLAVGTFFGQLWSVSEYQKYSIRGKSELTNSTQQNPQSGLGKDYAFGYSNGISEPLTLLIPNIVGGASSNFLVQDEGSKTYQALVQSGDNNTANQLAQYTSAYWGEQRISAPYYAGAIIVFLFIIGILFAEKRWVWWLASLAVLSVMMSWGKSFPAFNYFLFDYLPGYNKFRSVTFTLIIVLFSMPLLGLMGLEKLMSTAWDKQAKTKLLVALTIPGVICLFFWATGGMGSFMRDGEKELPTWFLNALKADRQSLLRDDAFRSLAFILSVFIVLYFQLWKKVSPIFFYAFVGIMIVADIVVVDRRYFTKENFVRKTEVGFDANESDIEIMKDKSHYRVYNLMDIQNPFGEARTSYFHNSLSGYHGAKMRKYQDLYDSALYGETVEAINGLRNGNRDFSGLGVINMLNTKYLLFGEGRNEFLSNSNANGNAWFVSNVEKVAGPNEEITRIGKVNTRTTAVVSDSRFTGKVNTDSAATITLMDRKPFWQKYEANTTSGGLAVISEIYYPKGWSATIDGQPATILNANYVLRAIEVPAGKHVVEFTFAPKPYVVGNKITMASSWIVLLVFLGAIGLSFKKDD